METIKFETSDGVTIVGDWYEAEGEARATILLLHMMPANRHSWAEFAQALTAAGYNALAIDERGHGDSTQQGDVTLDYRNFGEEEQKAKALDIDAALEFIMSRGTPHERIGVVGGSIGANLAIDLGARDAAIAAIVALSPGLNYRGVKTEPLARELRPDQNLMLVVAGDDTHTTIEDVQVLEQASGAQTTLKTYETGGHATDLFASYPELIPELVDWLTTVY